MSSVVADTHAICWFLSEPDRLSPRARAALRNACLPGEAVYVSVISLVEMEYLAERGRIPREFLERLWAELRAPAPQIVALPVGLGVAQALSAVPREAVPDMPDRIIAATAVHLGLPVVTRDGRIHAADVETIW